MANVKYIETISASLNGIEKKFGQMIICSDTNDIYYDNSDNVRINMNSIVQVESEEELNTITNPITSKIYLVKLTGKIYTYVNGQWKPINNMTKSMVFYLGNSVKTGIYPMMLQVPDNSLISSISGLCSVPGTTLDTKLDVLICKVNTDPLVESNWVSIFNTDKQFIIPVGSIYGNTAYELKTSILSKDDLIRINILESDTSISGITINIKLSI